MRCVDFHTHLFDVAFGGRAAHERPLPGAALMMRGFAATGFAYLVRRPGRLLRLVEDGVRAHIGARMRRAAPADLARAMDGARVGVAVVLPVHPHVPTARVVAACDFRATFPFCSPPVDRPDCLERAAADLSAGCLGIKIHPLVQNLPLDAPVYRDLFELAAARGVPLLTHFGGSGRMFDRARCAMPLEVRALRDLARARPDGALVVGHAGLWQGDDVLEAVRDLEGVFLETSFQGPAFIARAVRRIGDARLLFGSDFPIGDPRMARGCVERAAIPPRSRERILRGNALALLRIDRARKRAEPQGGDPA